MAITYSLDMAATVPASVVGHELSALARAAGLESVEVSDHLLSLRTPTGMWVQVMAENPPSWNPVVTDLGFHPTVSVGFRLDKVSDIGHQQNDMIRLTSDLLHRVEGDAVLHSQFEQIWLLRRLGELTVSEREDIWPPERLAIVDHPFRRITREFSEQ